MSTVTVFDCTSLNMALVDQMLSIQVHPPIWPSPLTLSDTILLPTFVKPVKLPISNAVPDLLAPETLLHLLHIPSAGDLLCMAAVASTGIIGLAAYYHATTKAELPKLYLQPTPITINILKRIHSIQTPYCPRPFCSYGHIETLAAAIRASPRLPYSRRCIPLPDGGTLSLDWASDPNPSPSALPPDNPILLLLPGRPAGSQDPTLQHAAALATAHGFRAAVFNPRGAAHSPLTSPSLTSIPPTADLVAAVAHISTTYPAAPLLAAGYSLGANLLLRYLAEHPTHRPSPPPISPPSPTSPPSNILAAVAISTPFDLPSFVHALTSGLPHLLYHRPSLAALKSTLAASTPLFAHTGLDAPAALRSTTLPEFDTHISAPSLHLPSASTYYHSLSCTASLASISVPLLLVHALDDPLVPPPAIPVAQIASNPSCVLLTTACGGHMGWLAGAPSMLQHSWADEVMVEFLQSALVELSNAHLCTSLGLPLPSAHPPHPSPPPALSHDPTFSTLPPISPAPCPFPTPLSIRTHARSASGTLIEDSPRVLHGRLSHPPPRPLPDPLPRVPQPLFWDDLSLYTPTALTYPHPLLSPSATPPTHRPLLSPPSLRATDPSAFRTPPRRPSPARRPRPRPAAPLPHQLLDDALAQWDVIYDMVNLYPLPPPSPSPCTPTISPPTRTSASLASGPPAHLPTSTSTAATTARLHPGACTPTSDPISPDCFKTAHLQQALATACHCAMTSLCPGADGTGSASSGLQQATPALQQSAQATTADRDLPSASVAAHPATAPPAASAAAQDAGFWDDDVSTGGQRAEGAGQEGSSGTDSSSPTDAHIQINMWRF